MARRISMADASATWPRTSSVAGLTLANVAPESASTSAPSISIRASGLTLGVSATAVPPVGRQGVGQNLVFARKSTAGDAAGNEPVMPELK
jgi:hypothetical protein